MITEEMLVSKQWEEFSYLQKVASDFGVSKEKYLEKIDSIGGVIPGDRNEINKLLLSIELEEKKDDLSWFNDIEQTLKRRFESYKEGAIQLIKNNKNTQMEEIGFMYASIEERLKKIHKLNLDLDIVTNRVVDFKSEFNKILSDGFWEFDRIEFTSILVFKTKNDVIIIQKNEAAGIDRYVNFGKFEAVFSTENNTLRVKKRENNLDINGYYSPYISREASICWGESGKIAATFQSEREYAKLFSMLATLLSTYDENTTPYKRLEDFQKEYNKKIPVEHQKTVETICNRCEYDEDSCVCSHCDTCGNYDDDIDACNCYWCDHCEGKHERRGDCPDYCSICDNIPCLENCCTECGNTSDNCQRCGECNSHADHEESCSLNQNESEET